ncbi:MAG: DUF3108 domain-containing protein [Bacteroidetes bacterium]|nr:DUF3108 domain-containing protein [Bacteroidota bacterium]
MLKSRYFAALLICLPVFFTGKVLDPDRPAKIKNAILPNPVFSADEELTYEVSWHLIKLGTITVKFVPDKSGKNPARHKAACYIDSYSGLPFVDVHSVFETVIDSSGFSYYSFSRDKDGDEWNFFYYDYEYENNKVIIKESVSSYESGRNGEVIKQDTIAVDGRCIDGLSILYFARANLDRQEKMNVPTIVASRLNYTEFNFQKKRTSVEIDAVNYPVDVVELNGSARYSGIFGLSGYFEGWFSNDTASVPIKGKLKVILGSVSIELKKWKRGGWNPPAYNPAE